MATEMVAGRELDVEIAKRVFGREMRGTVIWEDLNSPNLRHAPHYSTAMADAWAIIEHLMGRGMGYTVASGSWPDGRRYHVARFFPSDMSRAFMGDGDTAPLAICRCALVAVAEMEGEPR